jgi:E3 ubiquitin-protein ligase HUWE1
MTPAYPGTLLAELREYNLEQQRRAQCETLSPDGLPEEQPQTTKLKGKMQSRWVVAVLFGCWLDSGTF